MTVSAPLVDRTGEPLCLLAVHAHPDDESSKGSATMAKYLAQGARVVVVTCTGGERGDVLNPRLDSPEVRARLPEVRREEMARALEVLGVEHAWLGFVDSGLPEGDPPSPLPEGCLALQDVDEAAATLVAVIRDVRPQVLLTYDELGGYPHPDHLMTHRLSMRAAELCGDGRFRPELGAPWQVSKIYYQMMFHRERFQALHDALLDEGLPSPFEERLATYREGYDPSLRVTTRVPCADWFGVRDNALRAHATQVADDSHWLAVPLEVAKRAYPTEDFELAWTCLEPELPETDLFAGLRAGEPLA